MRQSTLFSGVIFFFWTLWSALLWAQPLNPALCSGWPAWEQFKKTFVSSDGRVIDLGSERQHTVSEGQSYALFFALVANDRASFDRILNWTEKNLAQGDLTRHLPAWIWGRKDDHSWGVLDKNSASDSDLWIAYALLEAGELWGERRYTALGTLLAHQIARKESAVLPGLGRTLLPGPQGFHPRAGMWRLNPSYVPLSVMRRLAARFPQATWPQMAETSIALLSASAPKGFSPEWVEYHTGQGMKPDTETRAEGSYNAIRVYLWAGMLSPQDPAFPLIRDTFIPMAAFVGQYGYPPERIHTLTLSTNQNAGNSGFSAAVLPYLVAVGRPQLAEAQKTRVDALNRNALHAYYAQVLTLFGVGWYEGRYRFEVNGALHPVWSKACTKR